MSFMREHHIVYQNKCMYYRKMGSGPLVVLLHGFAEDNTIWTNLTLQLQKEFTIIMPDLPGSGRSEFMQDAGFDEYVEILHQILQTENPREQFVLIGHSMGGYISLAFAEKYPSQLAGLGLFHSTAYADSDERKNIRRKAIAFVQEKGTKLFFESTINNLFTEEFATKYPGELKNQIVAARDFSVATVAQYYQAMINRPDRRHMLKTATYPVLFIMGRHDKAVPIEQNLTECHLPAQSHVHILENTAHMGMLEDYVNALAAIQSFLGSINH